MPPAPYPKCPCSHTVYTCLGPKGVPKQLLWGSSIYYLATWVLWAIRTFNTLCVAASYQVLSSLGDEWTRPLPLRSRDNTYADQCGSMSLFLSEAVLSQSHEAETRHCWDRFPFFGFAKLFQQILRGKVCTVTS